MRTKVVTVATRPDPGLDMLVKSMERFAIYPEILGMGQPWKGFGTKVILLKEYLEAIKKEYSHVIFVDAYDVAFLADLEEIERVYRLKFPGKIVFSAELNCWPDSKLSDQYPEYIEGGSKWRFLNSGSYMGPIDGLLEVFKAFPPEYAMDDQLYFTKVFLGDQPWPIVLDSGCRIFQTTAFCHGGEFSYNNGRLINNHLQSLPVIIHGNGRTPMDKVYELLKH